MPEAGPSHSRSSRPRADAAASSHHHRRVKSESLSPLPSSRSHRVKTAESEDENDRLARQLIGGRAPAAKRRRTDSSRSRSHSRSLTPETDEDVRWARRAREEQFAEEERAEREDRKRRKQERRQRKDKKKDKAGPVSTWGQYGLISMADYYDKQNEFRAWLVEVKMLNPETLPRARMKELFATYAEDFNTVTLPSEKYYALEPYEARMRSIRMGEAAEQEVVYDSRRDEAVLKATSKKLVGPRGQTLLTKDQLLDLQRIERERTEAARMRRMGLQPKESMGIRYRDPREEDRTGNQAPYA